MSQNNPLESYNASMNDVVSLCKRRGFIFQSSEIYGGLRSFYDYGPLGHSLKKNIASLWWHHMVDGRDNVVGMDASIVMHPAVWKASGHIDGFSDPLVDCKNCKERFRADKQPYIAPKTEVKWKKNHWISSDSGGKPQKHVSWENTQVGDCGYVCPNCGSTELSEERSFCGMFRSFLGAIDVLEDCSDESISRVELVEQLQKNSIYLRPETAQAMFTQYLNIQQSMGLKIPFGIAQQGRSFRNEIVVEHFIFRSCEFEQMEMEFFCEPGTEHHWLEYWCGQRLAWYQHYGVRPQSFRLRKHDPHELAHYSNACYDIEYRYPWGWDELEGVACRGDYDLKVHAKASRTKLMYLDPQKSDPDTNKAPWRYYPTVVEPAAGLTRAVLCFLLDAYTYDKQILPSGDTKKRMFLKLHPALAPYKVAILPVIKKEEYIHFAQHIANLWRGKGIALSLDVQHSIGKRYAKHDEIGTPFALAIDAQSLEDSSITLRNRNTTKSERMTIEDAEHVIRVACAPAAVSFPLKQEK